MTIGQGHGVKCQGQGGQICYLLTGTYFALT